MGILDDAIREHLELKRQHGAAESEVESLEAEAFGPADRPDAVDAAPAYSEDETQVISPGSAITTPAGEGDQLDKVFEASREEQAAEAAEAGSEAEPTGQTAAIEQPIVPIPPAPSQKAQAPDAPAPETVEDEPVDEGPHEDDDAGDALERERHALAGQPTEHYDVDAAIAEEDEIDILSESSLSDELDRALDGPLDEAATTEAPPLEAPPVEPVEPVEPAAEPDLAEEPISEELDVDELDAEVDQEGDADFFDQDDPLEGTPDFLEETPEHDRLWFEQKQPKDFDFGD
jgi:hypothetical protein